jgi:hypothetical protein
VRDVGARGVEHSNNQHRDRPAVDAPAPRRRSHVSLPIRADEMREERV